MDEKLCPAELSMNALWAQKKEELIKNTPIFNRY